MVSESLLSDQPSIPTNGFDILTAVIRFDVFKTVEHFLSVCVCCLKAPGTNVVFSGGAKTKNVCAFHCKLFVVVIWLSFRY